MTVPNAFTMVRPSAATLAKRARAGSGGGAE